MVLGIVSAGEALGCQQDVSGRKGRRWKDRGGQQVEVPRRRKGAWGQRRRGGGEGCSTGGNAMWARLWGKGMGLTRGKCCQYDDGCSSVLAGGGRRGRRGRRRGGEGGRREQVEEEEEGKGAYSSVELRLILLSESLAEADAVGGSTSL